MSYKIGDIIEVIDDTVKGRILSIKRDHIIIRTEEGFDMEVESDMIVKSGTFSAFPVDYEEMPKVLKEKGDTVAAKKPEKAIKKRDDSMMEVDLHIHELVASTRGMSNHEMLDLQVETAREKLNFAIKKRIRKVVFIHGVGEGVLKNALNAVFKDYDNINWYDASYEKYGRGATEVYIYQNY